MICWRIVTCDDVLFLCSSPHPAEKKSQQLPFSFSPQLGGRTACRCLVLAAVKKNTLHQMLFSFLCHQRTLESQNLPRQTATPLLLALLSLAEWIFFNFWGEKEPWASSTSSTKQGRHEIVPSAKGCASFCLSSNYYNCQVLWACLFVWRLWALYNHCPIPFISQIALKLPSWKPLSLDLKDVSFLLDHKMP